jgi:hypothetical protein
MATYGVPRAATTSAPASASTYSTSIPAAGPRARASVRGRHVVAVVSAQRLEDEQRRAGQLRARQGCSQPPGGGIEKAVYIRSLLLLRRSIVGLANRTKREAGRAQAGGRSDDCTSFGLHWLGATNVRTVVLNHRNSQVFTPSHRYRS